jgi:hypothetical protein
MSRLLRLLYNLLNFHFIRQWKGAGMQKYASISSLTMSPAVYPRAHIAGRLNPDLDPEARVKPPNLYSKCGGAKPRPNP